ncbi:hypothetical protein VTH06DRAFT_7073 [Thermothelomyces fergusii]
MLTTRRYSYPRRLCETVSIRDGQLLSFISASFLFRDEEGKAGQSVRGQLSIRSNAQQDSAPVTLDSVYLSFAGSLDGVVLRHQHGGPAPQRKGSTAVFTVPLTKQVDGAAETGSGAAPEAAGAAGEVDHGVTLVGSADLTLPPGQTLVFNLEIPLREPGQTSANSLTVNVRTDSFDLRQSLAFDERRNVNLWYLSPLATKHVAHRHPLAVRVLPRPPKMEIRCPSRKEQYYTDEPIRLGVEIENGEDTEALARLDVVLLGDKPPLFTVAIPERGERTASSLRSEEARLAEEPIGAIAGSASLAVGLRMPPIARSGRYDLTVKVTYFLAANPGTPITQTAGFQLNVVSPFEASYELVPRVHPDPWPSFFDPEGVPIPSDGDGDGAGAGAGGENDVARPPRGISQAWSLVVRYASFAAEPLRVTDVAVAVQPSPTFRCSAVAKHSAGLPPSAAGRLVPPKTIEEAAFDLSARKLTVDDRAHAPLDMSLVIRWARAEADADADADAEEGPASRRTDGGPPPATATNTTILPIPRFTIFGTEPRVLATVAHHHNHRRHPADAPAAVPVTTLTVTIENASAHFLTFGLSMDPSEHFAFSGPKQTTLNLLPVSRRAVEYRLLPVGRAAGTAAGDEGAEREREREQQERERERERDRGGVWVRPGLVVRDKYFQKVLRVLAGGDGVRMARDGFEVWLPTPTRGRGRKQ